MNRLTTIPRWLVALFVSALPTLVTFLLTRFYLQANLFNFVPAYWNDQTWYWHQTLSFSRVGFASGYYVLNEALAPLAFFKFSSAGPLFPVVFGALGHLIGWSWVTGIVLNMLLLAAAIFIFISLAQLDKIQILVTGFVLLVIGPVLMYVPSNSQESFHQAGALVLAGLFYRLWMGKMSRRLWWVGLVFLIFISLIRFSWVILLPAYLLISDQPISIRRVSFAIVVGIAMAFTVYLLVSYTSSPGHNAIVQRVGMGRNPLTTIINLFNMMQVNLDGSFLGTLDLQRLDINHVQGIQIAIIVLGALVMTFPAQELRIRLSTKPLEMPFHLYNLGVMVFLSLVLYLSGGFYRVFGLHVLLSLLLLIAFRRFSLVMVISVISTLMIGTFFTFYKSSIKPNLLEDVPMIEATRQQWTALMPYEPNADPWCNTLLMPVNLLDKRVLFVPAGIGVSFYYPYFLPTADHPVRSHYLLLDKPEFDTLSASHLHVQQLADTSYGVLYRNQDASCGPYAVGNPSSTR